MELAEHYKLLKRYKVFICVFTILVGVTSLLVGIYKPTNYKAAVSFDVNLINRDATADYQYGSYYDLKGAEMFTQTAMSWLKTPAVIAEIYKKAGLSGEIKNLDRFTNRFTVKQPAAQNFIVYFTDLSSANAEKIATSLSTVIIDKAKASAKDINGQALFEIKAAEPIVVVNEINLYLISILGLVAGFVISLLLIYLKHYLQSTK